MIKDGFFLSILVRPFGARPYGVAPVRAGGFGSSAGAGALGGALGAIGGTLGCLLCLSALGALGLFSCVVAITAYTSKTLQSLLHIHHARSLIFHLEQFLDAFKTANGISDGAVEMQMGLVVLLASLFYTILSRIQRS